VVHSVHHILRRNHPPAEETSVQTSDSVLASLDAIKLDVNLAIVVVERETDVHDMPVLVLALDLDVFFELALPVGVGFPAEEVSKRLVESGEGDGVGC